MRKTTVALSSAFLSLASPAFAGTVHEEILEEQCSNGESMAFHGFGLDGEHNEPQLVFAYCESEQVVVMSCYWAALTHDALQARRSEQVKAPETSNSRIAKTNRQIRIFENAIERACDIQIT